MSQGSSRIIGVLVSSALLFVFANVILFFHFDRQPPGAIAKYGMARIAESHPGWSHEDLELLDRESFGSHLALRYHPFAAFRTPAATGRFVNVAAPGYRSHRPLPWPPTHGSCTYFLFGGSTAFGLGLSDSEGLGAQLDAAIRQVEGSDCAVYNFSVPAHFSSNEQALFADLVREGFAPRTAIFVDGINDFHYADGRPEFYYRLDHFMSRRSRFDFLYSLPLARWARGLGDGSRVGKSADESESSALRAATRLRRNVEMTAAVGASQGIRTLFVIQPSPAYRYDLRHHLFAHGQHQALGLHSLAAKGYELLAREPLVTSSPLARTLWLADLQASRQENLYVDLVHYTAAFSSDVAREIARAAVADP